MEILETRRDTFGRHGEILVHTNGDMRRFLDMSWDLIRSVFLYIDFSFLNGMRSWGRDMFGHVKAKADNIKCGKGRVMPTKECKNKKSLKLYPIGQFLNTLRSILHVETN